MTLCERFRLFGIKVDDDEPFSGKQSEVSIRPLTQPARYLLADRRACLKFTPRLNKRTLVFNGNDADALSLDKIK